MEHAVHVFVIIHLLTIGLSHVFAPRAWAEFFALLRGKGEPGVFVVAFMSLGFGSVVAAFHPVWSGLPAVVTCIGWGQVLKALVYFLFPAFGLRRLGMVPPEKAHLFVYAGLIAIALAGLLIYGLATV